jgi:peptidyl-prolyl cis-trans isomerase A (cyclophilin A)
MKLLFILFTLFSQDVFAGTIINVETTKGNFELELNDELAPISTKNFLSYVDSGFYNGTIFHRTVKNFVIQGGGLTSDMQEKQTLPPIVSEATNGLSNLKGTIGMARTDDINSATSQFFINTKDNIKLDHTDAKYGYAVFGKVITGYDVVEVIENSPVQTIGEYENVPLDTIVIKSMVRK